MNPSTRDCLSYTYTPLSSLWLQGMVCAAHKQSAHKLTQQRYVGHLIEVKVIRSTGILQTNGRLARLYLNDVRVPAVEHHAHKA